MKRFGLISLEDQVKETIREIGITNISISELEIPVNEIQGIGPSYTKKLQEAGVQYIHQFITFTVDELVDQTGITKGRMTKWFNTAMEIANDPENEIYKKFHL